MSKIDPIYVYNRHQSPVSAISFGRYSQQPVLVSGSNDGELHVWSLADFETLAKIHIHQSKVLGLECLDDGQVEGSNRNEKMNQNLPDDPNTDKGAQNSKSRSLNEHCGLRFLSQEKNGLIKFVCLFRETNEEIIKFRIYNELSCSSCTFCPFQVLTVGNRLLLAYISTGSSNCVSLAVMNEAEDHKYRKDELNNGYQHNHGLLTNKRIVQIDQSLGMISSMKMKMYAGILLLLIGTESGSCLIYTGCWNDDSSKDKDTATNDEKVDNRFTLKYQQQFFKNTFVSSVELDDSRLFSNHDLRIICGSVEDYLAVADLIGEFADHHLDASKDTQHNLLQTLNEPLITSKDVASHRPPEGDLASDERQHKQSTGKPQSLFRNKEKAKPVKYLKITNKGINSIVSRLDGKLFASAGYDGRVRLFSLKSLKALAVLAFHKQTIEMIKFSAYLTDYKGYLLAAVGQDKLVTIWSIYNG